MYLWELVRGLTDHESRLEYFAGAPDGKTHLRFQGLAKQGTPTSSDSWIIQRFEYVAPPVAGDSVLSRIQVLIGKWDDRVSLPWGA